MYGNKFGKLNYRGSEFDILKPLTVAQIKHEESKIIMKFESETPALLGEWFPIRISIIANENISNAILRIALSSDSTNEQSSRFFNL